MPTTEWVQLDGFRTREEHRITPRFTDLNFLAHDESAGPILQEEFIEDVYNPSLDEPMLTNTAQVNDRRISYVYLREWFTTLGGGGGLFGADNYDSAAQVWGSVGGVHDWNPLAWEAETRLAAMADFDASPPPGVTFRYLEWETNPFQPGPFGTYTGRTIELSLPAVTFTEYDRDGDPVDVTEETPLEHAVAAIGRNGETTSDNWAHTWDAAQDWYVVGGFAGSLQDAAAAGEVLASFGGGGSSISISDGWWEENSFPSTGLAEGEAGTSKTTLAVPLVFGPSAGFGLSSLPTTGEFERSWRQLATLFFEHNWTPPRYRIVYTTADTPAAPVLRHYPRDGDGRGWGGVTRGYPPPRGRRGYGGARQP